MQNPLCDICNCLVSNPVETKDGKRVCPSCLDRNFEAGVMKVEPKAVVFKSAVPAKPAQNTPSMTDLMVSPEAVNKVVSESVKDNDGAKIPGDDVPIASPKIIIDDEPETEVEAFEKEFEKADETPVEVPKASAKKSSRNRRR